MASGPKIRDYIDSTECDRFSICYRKMEIGIRWSLGDLRVLHSPACGCRHRQGMRQVGVISWPGVRHEGWDHNPNQTHHVAGS